MNAKRAEPGRGRTRSDAHRTRQRILSAAVDVIVEQGTSAPLKDIAGAAEVSVATVHRHFPDRTILLRHVALDRLARITAEAENALTEEPDAFRALVRYMHRAIDLKISLVMPKLVTRLQSDPEVTTAHQASAEAVNTLVDAAHQEGSLRSDVAPGDIGLLITRMAHPLPGPIPPEVNRSLSHRHLELVLDGLLGVFASDGGLPGPKMTFRDLAALDDSRRNGWSPVS